MGKRGGRLAGWSGARWALTGLIALAWALLVAFWIGIGLSMDDPSGGETLSLLILIVIEMVAASSWVLRTGLLYSFEKDKCLLMVKAPMQDIVMATRTILERAEAPYEMRRELRMDRPMKRALSPLWVFLPAIDLEIGDRRFTVYVNPWRGAFGMSTQISIGPCTKDVEHRLKELLRAIWLDLRSNRGKGR